MSEPSRTVKLPPEPGCVPTLGLPFLLAAPVLAAIAVYDGFMHRASWPLGAMATVLVTVVGTWGVFARHGFEVDLGAGVVRSGTGLFRPSLRREHVLGLPLRLELAPFKLERKGAIETAYMVMLAGPAGRLKLDDFPDKPSAERRKDELAILLGLSPPNATS